MLNNLPVFYTMPLLFYKLLISLFSREDNLYLLIFHKCCQMSNSGSCLTIFPYIARFKILYVFPEEQVCPKTHLLFPAG